MAYEDAYTDCKWMDFDLVYKFMKNVLMASGVPEKDADIVSDVLITSDKYGIDSHGIGRLKPIYIDRIDSGTLNPLTQISIVRDRKTTAVLDGNNGMGHVIAKNGMQMAMDKARVHGMGMVAVRNSTHYGIAGYYARMAAKKGMIGITGTNARPSIAPTFGVENMLGTNPLTVGFPTDEDFPFILDCATSVSQRGKIEVYGRAEKQIPSGWVIGQEGNTRTDTVRILEDLTLGKAALSPLGGLGEKTAGYKGYGYATIVEVLCAALQGGKFLKQLSGKDADGNKTPIPLGHFFMAVDIEEFTGLDKFKATAGQIMRDLRASKKAPGQDRIYTAGEKEWLAWQYRKVHGCPVPKSLQAQMTELNHRFNLNYCFDFDQ
ncbi:MAG: Ldh family oxidoreductase [Desulfobacter sp.]|nr:Ldh family oxidoreductase [Desulfobacter sp.]